MTQTLEAAYHEAGHAVLAHLSDYHFVSGPVSVASFGGGLTDISPSKKRLKQAGKDPASYDSDPEVAQEMAGILAAGLAAKHIAAAFHYDLSPNPTLSKPDHQLIAKITAAAGITSDITPYQYEAAGVLCVYWKVVATLANELDNQISIDAVEVGNIIDRAVAQMIADGKLQEKT